MQNNLEKWQNCEMPFLNAHLIFCNKVTKTKYVYRYLPIHLNFSSFLM